MSAASRCGGRFAALLCLLLCLCGCSERFARRAGDAASLRASNGGGPGAAAKAALRVNLAGLHGIDEAQAAALARAWEAASGVRAEITLTGTGAADVTVVSSSTVGDAVDAKQITALSGDLPDAGAPLAARRALMLDGKTYALPLTARLRVLTYDPERLRRAGLDDRPAPTLEGLRAQWQEASRAALPAISPPPPAVGKAAPPPGISDSDLAADVALFAAAFGGELVSGNGSLALASRPVVQGVEYLKTLRDGNLLSPSGQAFALTFVDGTAGDPVNTAPLPVALAAYDAAARPFAVTGDVYGVAVAASATNKTLAERFVRFVTDPMVARGWLGARSLGSASAENSLPARLTARIIVPGGPLARSGNRAVLERYARSALEGTIPVSDALARAAAEIEGQSVTDRGEREPPPHPSPE